MNTQTLKSTKKHSSWIQLEEKKGGHHVMDLVGGEEGKPPHHRFGLGREVGWPPHHRFGHGRRAATPSSICPGKKKKATRYLAL
jgi:hypothetical protein